MKKLRIFISSPGDVRPERVRANDVVLKLQTKYRAFVELEAILWEHDAMSACSTPQDQIIPPSKTDIVICILWSRMGTRLPAGYRRPDGSVPTGTEWEFEDAYAAHQAKGVPDLYVYRKTAPARIEVGVDGDHEFNEWKQQKMALDRFLDRWLKGQDGSFKAEFNRFDTDEKFEEMLAQHLDRIIQNKIRSDQGGDGDGQKITWFVGSPFLGLSAFQPEHASIFFGRDLDTRKILNRLKKQSGSGRVFLMVLGMSGCGKSSLARAGVLPALQRPGETEWDCWRHLILRPSEATNGLLSGLSEALLKSLPELGQSGYDAGQLAVLLRDAPVHAVTPLGTALDLAAKACAQGKGLRSAAGARLFLLIDQFEEVFTLDCFREEKTAFVGALAALSRSGLVWVFVTMRSDLYGHCTEINTLMELKGDDGQYDLTPPGIAELPQMIRLPALAAGLQYETDPKTGQRLDDALLEEAWKNPESLPLLEFTLDELFKGRRDRLLTWQAYHELGGLKGAIATCAEEEYSRLSGAGQEAVPWVFGRLVTLEHNHATAQQARASEFAARPGADEVVQRFIKAKLFVAAAGHAGDPGGENVVVVSIAHEALLESWPLLQDWIESHRENLKSHAAVTADTKRWIENNRNPDYLYRSGLPLKRAQMVLKEDSLSGEEEEFVRASLRNVAKQEFQQSLATGERMLEVSGQLRDSYPDLRQQILRESLASETEQTCANAASLMGMQPVEELTGELTRLVLNHPNESVRRAAAASLVQLDHAEYFEALTKELGIGDKPQTIRALAHVRAAADAVETPTFFEQKFQILKSWLRWRIISQSWVLRLKRGLPTLMIVVIPAVVLSAIVSAMVKFIPGFFNYGLCQGDPNCFAGAFDGIVASVLWGGLITLCIIFHRVVFGSEQGSRSFLQPWGTLVAGAIGGVISSLLVLMVVVNVCDSSTCINIGWTTIDREKDRAAYWHDLLSGTRCYWADLLMGTGLGIGMGCMSNGLRASKNWGEFLGGQSSLTGASETLSLIRALARLMLRFAWPIVLCLLIADLVAFGLLRTAPQAVRMPPAESQWHEALLGGMAHDGHARRMWKAGPWGQGFGIGIDSTAQAVGGFFCIVGMGLGIVAIRYGVRIEPRKN